MPQDIVAVASCHHKYAENVHNPKDAALVSLALRLDMLLGQEDTDPRTALQLPEMDFLEMPSPMRQQVLEAAIEAREAALKTANV